MKNEPPKFNDVKYGEATIIAIDMNHWILPGNTATNPKTTRCHQVALAAAQEMNKMMGGETKAARRMSGNIRSDLV